MNHCMPSIWNDEGQQELSSRLDVLSSRAPSDVGITESKVRAFLRDYYEDYGSMGGCGAESWDLFFDKYFVQGFQWIRPSGNPIGKEGLIEMFTKDNDLVEISLVSIDSITILAGQRSAIALFTTDQIFCYKGRRNEDRAVISGVMEMHGGGIKMVQEHRTSGKPIPRETRWATNCDVEDVSLRNNKR